MKKSLFYIIPVFILLTYLGNLSAQEDGISYITILKFEIEGNYKTKDGTIIRELDFNIGDSLALPDLANRLQKNQTLLMNTNLFYEVEMNVGEWDATNNVSIKIKVREAWYIYPVPIFELADRNFNVWWQQYNHSFKRVDYGVRLYHSNMTGRRDRLKAVIQLGFTQKYELEYSIPFINKKKTIGISTNFLFTRNKEIGLRTFENDVLFYRDDNRHLLKRYRFGIGMSYQPKLYEKQQINLNFYQRNIADSIQILNSEFLLDGRTKQRFLATSYTYTLDKRDSRVYPLAGRFVRAKVEKEGFGIFKDRNTLTTTASYGEYIQLGKKKKFSISTLAKARYQILRQRPAYYDNQALGYEEDFIRGYEFYVMDGLDFGYMKNSLRYEILNKNFKLGKIMPLKAFKVMPFRMYLSLNGDWGYVNDPHYNENNPLTNEWLVGGGIGLDFILYVDKIIQVEYSTNRLGEKGVYLHFSLFF